MIVGGMVETANR